MRVHFRLHVVDDALGDGRIEPRLEEPEGVRDDCHQEGRDDQLHQDFKVPGEKTVVDHPPGEQGRHDAECRRKQYDDNNDEEFQFIRTEIAEDPQPEFLRELRSRRFLFVRQATVRAGMRRRQKPHSFRTVTPFAGDLNRYLSNCSFIVVRIPKKYNKSENRQKSCPVAGCAKPGRACDRRTVPVSHPCHIIHIVTRRWGSCGPHGGRGTGRRRGRSA